MVADFRGTDGDRDILLQATNSQGYRMGRFLAAYAYEDLLKGREPLWTRDDFVSCAHNSARLADLGACRGKAPLHTHYNVGRAIGRNQ